MNRRCVVVGEAQSDAVAQVFAARGFEVSVCSAGAFAQARAGTHDVDELVIALDPLPESCGTVDRWVVGTRFGGRWPASDGIRELAYGEPLTSVFVAHVAAAGARIIAKGQTRTNPYFVSRQTERVRRLVFETLDRAALRHLRGLDSDYGPIDTPLEPAAFSTGDAARLVLGAAARLASVQVDQTLRSDHWNIGIIDAPIHRFLDPDYQPSIDWAPPLPKRFYRADPMGVPGDGGAVDVFFERFDYRTGLGELGRMQWQDGTWSSEDDLLSLPTHLSFPSATAVDGQWFGVPENAESGEIARYRIDRARGVPRWMERETMVPFPGLDPVLFEHEGRWWLLAVDACRPDTNALYAWYSDAFAGPWVPHPDNPVRVGVESVRPAGPPFVHEGALYRPAQDSTAGYGAGVAICRIDELSPDGFRESVASRVTLRATGLQGPHTLAAVGERTLVDAKRRVVVPGTLPARMADRLVALGRLVRG